MATNQSDKNFQLFINNEVKVYKRGQNSFQRMMESDYNFDHVPKNGEILYETGLDDICDNVYLYNGSIHYTSNGQKKSIRMGTVRNYFTRANKLIIQEVCAAPTSVFAQTVTKAFAKKDNDKKKEDKQDDKNHNEESKKENKITDKISNILHDEMNLICKKYKRIEKLIKIGGKYCITTDYERIYFDVFAIIKNSCCEFILEDEKNNKFFLEYLFIHSPKDIINEKNKIQLLKELSSDRHRNHDYQKIIKIYSLKWHFNPISIDDAYEILLELHHLNLYLDLKSQHFYSTNISLGHLSNNILIEFEYYIKNLHSIFVKYESK